MSTNQNEADSNRSINPEEASSFQKLVFNSVANATVTLIAEDEIQECGLNLQKRTYVKPDSDEAKGVEDLAIQLSELSLLHPIIVVDLDGEIFLVSGRKRLEAFRHSRANSSDKKIPCKVLVYQDLFKGLSCYYTPLIRYPVIHQNHVRAYCRNSFYNIIAVGVSMHFPALFLQNINANRKYILVIIEYDDFFSRFIH